MDKLFEKMWTYVRHGQDVSLEIRFFRLITLMVALLCLFLVLPTNLLQDLSPYLNLTMALYGVAAGFLYYRSRGGGHCIKCFYALTLLVLNVGWFLNAGSRGSIGYFLFVAGFYPLIFFRGRTRLAMFLLLLLDLIGLVLVEHRFPHLVLPYLNQTDRLFDLIISFSTSALITALVLWVAVTSLERELEERRRAEVSLCRERDRAQGYLDTVETLIVALDAQGNISAINRKACQLLGCPEQELLGRSWFASCLPHPEGNEAYQWFCGLMQDQGEPGVEQLESPILTRSGALRQIVWHYSPLRDAEGEITGALASGEDITERKKAEESLRESEQALRLKSALLEAQSNATIDAILVIDSDRKPAFINRRFRELFEVPDQVLRDPDDAALLNHALGLIRNPEAFLKKVLQLYQQVNETSRDEIEFISGMILDRYSAPVLSEDGRYYGRIWTFRDVTDQKRYETERLKNEKLESLGVLAGGIAHDFNNILAGIMGGISFAQEFIEPGHQAYKPLETAEKASVRAADLARQLITFAKGGDLVMKVVWVRHIVEESVSFALRGSNVKGSVDIPEGVRAVRADEGQLGQALYNLILNAKQAMPKGGTVSIGATNEVLPASNVYALPAGEYVKLSCADQGCGISEADLRKIFDPYFTTKAAGNGLGLASVYSIVSKHGGSISVSSAPGEGATFTLYLPAVAECCELRQQEEVALDVGVPADGCVLVMDDEPMVRDLAREILSYRGYQVRTCENGTEAIELYQAAKESGRAFDAVVMDLTIPGGMGGKEAAERILAYDPKACLVVSSGYSNDPIMADYTAYGFKGAVAKPYTNRELWQLLGSLLQLPDSREPGGDSRGGGTVPAL